MGHTPGPFTRGYSDGSGRGDIVANGKRIASVIPGCSCCAKREEDMTPEDHANGDLFSAAPDMLAAIKWLADSASASQESQSPEAREWYAKDVWHGIELARAAIAKAEGK